MRTANTNEENALLGARLSDFVRAAGRAGIVRTPFLSPEQQSYALRYLEYESSAHADGIRYFFDGGYRDAERKTLVLLDPSFCPYGYFCGACDEIADGADIRDHFDFESADSTDETDGDDPFVSGAKRTYASGEHDPANMFCRYADECSAPRSLLISGSKYANLEHRSFMGAVLSAGLSRDAVGDIVVRENREAIIFTGQAAAELLLSQPPVLTYVGREKVTVSEIGLPRDFSSGREYSEINVSIASQRLDCIVSALCRMSRDKAKSAVLRGDVTLCGRTETRIDTQVSDDDTLSVRRFGKFRIVNIGGTTKSGRLKLSALRYR